MFVPRVDHPFKSHLYPESTIPSRPESTLKVCTQVLFVPRVWAIPLRDCPQSRPSKQVLKGWSTLQVLFVPRVDSGDHPFKSCLYPESVVPESIPLRLYPESTIPYKSCPQSRPSLQVLLVPRVDHSFKSCLYPESAIPCTSLTCTTRVDHPFKSYLYPESTIPLSLTCTQSRPSLTRLVPRVDHPFKSTCTPSSLVCTQSRPSLQVLTFVPRVGHPLSLTCKMVDSVCTQSRPRLKGWPTCLYRVDHPFKSCTQSRPSL